MRSFVDATLLFFLLLGACAPAERTDGAEPAEEAAREAVLQLRSNYQDRYNAQDAAGLAALYAEDATLSIPNQHPVKGREAVQSLIQATFDRFQAEVEISGEETEVAGNWAFDAGTAVQTLTPKTGGESVSANSSYLAILRRQGDDTWKLARLVISSDDPLPGSSPAQ